MKRDYYEVLGVERGASEADIKSAYRRQALKYHPDRNPGDHKAEERFKEAAEAYSVLADTDKRARYDRFGHQGVSAGGAQGFDPTIFADFGDLFSNLGDVFGFGDVFSGRGRRGGPQRGSDLRYDLEIAFDESFTGTESAIQIPRDETCETCTGTGAAEGTAPETCKECAGRGQLRYQQGFFTVARPCPHCRGTGRFIANPCAACAGQGRVSQERTLKIKIPAGIANGQQIRLYGEGEHGLAGGPAGDLYVVVHVADHAFFQREGDDLYLQMPVTFPALALGTRLAVPTPSGADATVDVPPGTASGTRLRVRGKGMPSVQGRGKGDLYVQVAVQVPKKLTKEQRAALEALAETMPMGKPVPADLDRDEDRSVFDKVKDLFG
ncbi:MAG TPA: molecular chaperone DnaJ [Vicinamibacterales bacterium]|nr:molecular chaperone DnaJ [Vicinamibacterales bacterium]